MLSSPIRRNTRMAGHSLTKGRPGFSLVAGALAVERFTSDRNHSGRASRTRHFADHFGHSKCEPMQQFSNLKFCTQFHTPKSSKLTQKRISPKSSEHRFGRVFTAWNARFVSQRI